MCRQIRQISIVPILFLSAKTEEVDKLISLGVGGDGYISKPFSPKEVVATVSSMLRRSSYYAPSVAKQDSSLTFGEYKIDFNLKELYKNDESIKLTAKEYHLLEYLVNNQEITVSREQILQEVWGVDFEGYDNTVMVHIRKLREKIEDEPSNPTRIITIKGRGYRFIL